MKETTREVKIQDFGSVKFFRTDRGHALCLRKMLIFPAASTFHYAFAFHTLLLTC